MPKRSGPVKSLFDSSIAPEGVAGESVVIRFVPLDVISRLDETLWGENPKKHDLKAIYKSIDRYGFTDPPKWDTNLNDGRGGLIYGNGRTAALVQGLTYARSVGAPPPRGIPTAIDGGDWCIPVKFGVDARSESEAKSFAIDHNNLVLSESFDAETVAGIWNESYLDLLQSIAESNELPVTVSSADLELLLSLGFEGDVGDQEDEQETADLIDKAADPGYLGRVKSGEAWRLGRHFLLCGDSTIEENTRKLMSIAQIKSIDGCWTDPPYGVSYVGKTKESLKIQNDSLNAEQLHEFLVKAFKSVSAASGGNSIPVYVAHPAGELHNTFYQAIIESQLVFKQTLVWVKNSFAMGRSDYHYQHEPIYYCCTPGADRPSRMGNGPWYGDHSQSSVFSFSKPNANRLHPTMKPVDLIEAMLKNSIPQSGWVFDPFGGSGSTLIAAEQLGMRALTIELDPRFASVIIDRWELLTGKEAERVRSN